jgi:hypothetical protein
MDFAALIEKHLAGTADLPIVLLCNTTPGQCVFSKRVIHTLSELSAASLGSQCLNIYVDEFKQSWGIWISWEEDEQRFTVRHGPRSLQTHAVNMGLGWKTMPYEVPEMFQQDVIKLSEEFRLHHPDLYEQIMRENP